MSNANVSVEPDLPSLGELGSDLLRVSHVRRFITLALPFLEMAGYALFAWLGWWPLAVACVMALSFTTYGSTSHDLVHRTLHLPRRLNDFLLSLIELLSLRSGTAYRLTHLHHHQHLLAADDVEGATAYGSLLGALASGPLTQVRLWCWARREHPEKRAPLLIEALGVFALAASAVVLLPWSPAPLVYVALVVAGSWLFPLITVYIPHDSRGTSELSQTRLFRGWLTQLVAWQHLYHLEHHLYPAVPHHHWRTLAQRLDPYLERAGVRPIA